VGAAGDETERDAGVERTDEKEVAERTVVAKMAAMVPG
jgi:hypothetical protein